MTAEWPRVQLREVAQLASRWVRPEPGTPYRQLGVRLHGLGAYERETIDGSETKYAVLNEVRAGDLVVNKIWAREGSAAVITPDLDGCFVSGEFPTYELDTAVVDVRWLHWLTMTNLLTDQFRAASQGTSGQNRIRPGAISTACIPLPPLVEQRRIIAKLEGLGSSVGEVKQLRAATAAETTVLYRAVHERVYGELLDEYGPTELGIAAVSITDGDHNTPQFDDRGVPFIFVGNVSSGRLHFKGAKCVSPAYFRSLKPARVPQPGDVLLSAVGATLGIPALVDTNAAFCFQRHIAIIKPDRVRVESRFLWHMLRSRTVFAQVWASTTGSAQPTIPLRAIRKLPVPLPPLHVQARCVEQLEAADRRLESLTQLQTHAAAEVDALLPCILDRAFSNAL